MSRDWQPGDVAMVRDEDGITHRAIVVNATHSGGLHVVVPTYATAHEMDAHQSLYFGDGAIRRPAVVDPEDREQVERLADAVLTEAAGYRIDKAILTVGLGKGLREFADPKPPKPDEPTGLGAVVEDAEGEKWVQFSSKNGMWWRSHIGRNARWHDIAAVRILSEGVTP